MALRGSMFHPIDQAPALGFLGDVRLGKELHGGPIVVDEAVLDPDAARNFVANHTRRALEPDPLQPPSTRTLNRWGVDRLIDIGVDGATARAFFIVHWHRITPIPVQIVWENSLYTLP